MIIKTYIFKHSFKGLLLVVALFVLAEAGYAQNKKQNASKNFYLGIDNSGDKCKPGDFFNPAAMDSLGVDFVVYHYRGPEGTVEDEAKKMEKFGNDFQKANLKAVVNVESGELAS